MLTPEEEGPLRIGDKFLGKYQILGVMGRGGHGCVYHAVNLFMGRHVAIKVLFRPDGISDEMLHRGQTEAALLGRLEHENIVRVHDAGIAESGHLYIVMELLKGRTLAQRLREEGPFGIVEGLEMLEALCAGLQEAHRENAIHRDLKPANIFLTDGGSPKVLDFGVAKIVGAVGYQTVQNMVVGTCLYMSPEQIQGQTATARSDIYALGLVMYECFAGVHPLLRSGDLSARDRLAVSWAQVKVVPPRLDEILPGFPDYVAKLIYTSLVKRPGQRYESAKQFGETAQELRERYLSENGLPIASASSRRASERPPGRASERPPWFANAAEAGAPREVRPSEVPGAKPAAEPPRESANPSPSPTESLPQPVVKEAKANASERKEAEGEARASQTPEENTSRFAGGKTAVLFSQPGARESRPPENASGVPRALESVPSRSFEAVPAAEDGRKTDESTPVPQAQAQFQAKVELGLPPASASPSGTAEAPAKASKRRDSNSTPSPTSLPAAPGLDEEPRRKSSKWGLIVPIVAGTLLGPIGVFAYFHGQREKRTGDENSEVVVESIQTLPALSAEKTAQTEPPSVAAVEVSNPVPTTAASPSPASPATVGELPVPSHEAPSNSVPINTAPIKAAPTTPQATVPKVSATSSSPAISKAPAAATAKPASAPSAASRTAAKAPVTVGSGLDDPPPKAPQKTQKPKAPTQIKDDPWL